MNMLLLLLFALFTLPVSAAAQECTVGVYNDAAGTDTTGCADPGQLLTVYVVIFAEDSVAAAAYSLHFEAAGPLFLQRRVSGPSGNGLVIDDPTGTNVALAECVIGFGGHPVLVDQYEYFMWLPNLGARFWVEPNTAQDPDYPLYVTCTDVIKVCTPGPPMEIPPDCWSVGVSGSRSFGAVKSLYR
jgi:hypothetical protein